jgi:hypothetical protein
MKKTLVLLMILISLSYCSCNRCGSGDNPTDPRISSCFFKVGSYFIYSDTTDHIIDSQYVFLYSYKPNSIPIIYDMCTEYDNQYEMWEASYRNSLLYDSIYSACNSSPGYLYLRDGINSSGTSTYYNPGMDTLFNNFFVDGYVYATVYKTEGIIYGINVASNITLDFYFAPGYGIVKKVEHRPTGDVSWDLIRYHILQ